MPSSVRSVSDYSRAASDFYTGQAFDQDEFRSGMLVHEFRNGVDDYTQGYSHGTASPISLLGLRQFAIVVQMRDKWCSAAA
jgi:hypothetical protein